MKIDILIDNQKGVINITSEQFIIEDLKAHICKKMSLDEANYKIKVSCATSPSLELVKVPSFSLNQTKKATNKNVETKELIGVRHEVGVIHWDIATYQYPINNADELSKNGIVTLINTKGEVTKWIGTTGYLDAYLKNSKDGELYYAYNSNKVLLYKIRISFKNKTEYFDNNKFSKNYRKNTLHFNKNNVMSDLRALWSDFTYINEAKVWQSIKGSKRKFLLSDETNKIRMEGIAFYLVFKESTLYLLIDGSEYRLFDFTIENEFNSFINHKVEL